MDAARPRVTATTAQREDDALSDITRDDIEKTFEYLKAKANASSTLITAKSSTRSAEQLDLLNGI
jgi:hypothetical protein